MNSNSNDCVLQLGDPDFLTEFGELVLQEINNYPGVKVGEVYLEFKSDISLEVEDQNLKRANQSIDQGYNLRVYDDRGSIGFALSNALDPRKIEDLVRSAISMMRVSSPDPDFHDLPPAANYHNVKGLVDSTGLANPVEDYERVINEMIESSRIDDRLYSLACEVEGAAGTAVLLNTNSLRAKDQWTIFQASVESVVKEGTDQTAGYKSQVKRHFDDIDYGKLAKDTTREALQNLGRVSTETGPKPVILEPRAVKSILTAALVGALSAEEVLEHRSFLQNMLGKGVAIDGMHLTSDPTLPRGISSGVCDGEGVPSKPLTLVEQGSLRHFLHNSYTAGKVAVENTGNASRSSYHSLPGITAGNILLAPGDATLEEMIAETKDGVFLILTGDRPNIVTGEFSGLIMTGYLIKNGEIADPVKNTNVAFDIKEALQQIDMISKEPEWVGSAYVPPLRITSGWISSG